MLSLLLGIGMVSYWFVSALSDTATPVADTAEALDVMEHVSALMKNAVAGTRGFLLTGASEDLQPLEAARIEIEPALTHLSHLIGLDPSQQSQVETLRSLSRRQLSELHEVLELRKTHGLESAIAAIRNRPEPRSIDVSRRLVKQMHDREKQKLTEQLRHMALVRGIAMMCMAGGSILALLVVASAGVMVVYDLRRLERTERALGISQNRQDLVLKTLPIVMYSAAPSGDFGTLWLSDNVVTVTGFPAEQFVKEPELWSARLHPDDRERVFNQLGRLRTEELIETEYRWQIADGTYHWFLDEARKVRKSDGTPLEIVGLWYDVTERRQIEEHLRQTTRLLQSVFDASPPAIVAVDDEGRVLIWNRAAERLFGWSEEEVLGRLLPIASGIRAEQHTMLRQQVFRGETLTEIEVLRERKDGSLVQVSLSVAPLYDGHGSIYGAMAVIVDISERKRAGDELHQSHEQLRALASRVEAVREEERTRIAREIHDELGQAMTGLKVDISWVYKQMSILRDLPQQSVLLDRLKSTMALLDETIRSVRQIATALRPGVLDELGLSAAIEWHAQDFESRTGIRCRVTIRPESLMVDPHRSTTLFRIVQELLTNIARHACATTASIILVDEAHRLLLEVKDNGKGIAESEIHDLHALGLVGVRERARQWGGEAVFHGIPQGGTTVTVSIPHEQVDA